MTNIVLHTDEGMNVHFECSNHSESQVVCSSVSALANVLLVAGNIAGHGPMVYDKEAGKIVLNIPKASAKTLRVVQCVEECFIQLAEQYPEYIRVY